MPPPEAIEGQLRELAAARRRLQRSLHRTQRVPPAMWEVAVLICLLAQADVRPALRFLERARPDMRGQRDAWEAALTSRLAEMPPAEKERLLNSPAPGAEEKRLLQARRTLEQDNLHS